jgi:hypothetical protein
MSIEFLLHYELPDRVLLERHASGGKRGIVASVKAHLLQKGYLPPWPPQRVRSARCLPVASWEAFCLFARVCFSGQMRTKQKGCPYGLFSIQRTYILWTPL